MQNDDSSLKSSVLRSALPRLARLGLLVMVFGCLATCLSMICNAAATQYYVIDIAPYIRFFRIRDLPFCQLDGEQRRSFVEALSAHRLFPCSDFFVGSECHMGGEFCCYARVGPVHP